MSEIINSYDPNTLETVLDQISAQQGVCIEIVTAGTTSYTSDRFNRGCMLINPEHETPKELSMTKEEVDKTKTPLKEVKEEVSSGVNAFRKQFMNSKKRKASIKLVNPRFKNQTLLYGVKLDRDIYAFISASMQPLDATTKILASQFIFVTMGVLFLSFVIGYLISKRISKPIIKLNDAARNMAKGDYDVVFETGAQITELNELASTLNYTRDELAGTEELRRELLANISHDLKTPLTMIKAYAEMVRDLSYRDDQKRTEHLNVIIEESDRLNLLVNDILDLSLMQSNLGMIEPTSFDVGELIASIVKRFEILTETEGYHFIINGPKHCWALADPKKIEQVIYNLIGNAINYTGEDGQVIIRISDESDDIHIEIIDTGKGIKPVDLNKIWEKYYKSDKKHRRNAYGTGIGLSIIKQILEKHEANYGVKSTLNQGTTFYFDLTKAKSDKKIR